jgi:chaperonin GroEL
MACDEELGHFIEEIFDIVGPEGHVEIRSGYGRQSEREYVEGVYWDAGWVSPYFADKDDTLNARVHYPYILITDLSLDSAQDLIPALEAVRKAEGKSFVVISPNLTGSALNLLVANNARETMRLLGLKAPEYGEYRSDILDDLALSTGARVIREGAGDSMAQVRLEDLGRAQYVACNRSTFTLVGTMGRPQAIRDRIHNLRQVRANTADAKEREKLDQRISKLLGGAALLYVSGQTDAERDQRKQRAEDAVRVVRLGLQGGVVPGGGSAFVACLPALDEVAVTEVEAPALNILREALLAPLACLARNAGYDSGPVLAHVQEAPPGWGFDVLQGEVVDMYKANIVDPLPMVRTALTYALSIATMAITTDALVHRDTRERMPDLEP